MTILKGSQYEKNLFFSNEELKTSHLLEKASDRCQQWLIQKSSSCSLTSHVLYFSITRNANFIDQSESISSKILSHFGDSQRGKLWITQEKRGGFYLNPLLDIIRACGTFEAICSTIDGTLVKLLIFFSPDSPFLLNNRISRLLLDLFSELPDDRLFSRRLQDRPSVLFGKKGG